NLQRQDLGFDRTHVLQIFTDPSQQGTTGASMAQLFHLVQERLSAIPGVLSASPASQGLLDNSSAGSPVIVPGHVRTDDEEYFVRWMLIAPGYLDTVGMKLVAGRDFTTLDTDSSSRVAIVNETMARYYFGSGTAIGKTFGMRRGTGTEITIVGVA